MNAPTQLPNGYTTAPSGLIVPPTYNLRSSLSNAAQHRLRNYSYFCGEGFSFGVRLPRDPDTLVIQWAPKGSGLDDLLMAAIADGEIANIGIAPVIWDQLSALILRRQAQINSASVVVTGRATPATRALNALARMNDSPLGAIAGIQRILYQLDVFNRGAPIATVPITYPTDRWAAEGMTLRPLLDDKGKPSGKSYLAVDWRGRSPVPYLPSVFDLEPTGNQEWPYWYHTLIHHQKHWVLLHQSQILSLLTAQTNRPGIGTSPVWLCLPVMAENTLVIDERYEKLIDKPTQGIFGISGVTQTADTIRSKIDEPDHTWTLLASPNDIKFGGWSFRQPDGVDWEQRQRHFEDVLASAFNEHLSSIVLRTGVGTATASEVAADNAAENGVFAILQAIEIAFGAIYPHVTIQVTKTNDRARHLGLKLLGMFTAAIKDLPADTLTCEELRALIDANYLTIPATAATITQSDARPGRAVENEEQAQLTELARLEDELAATLHDCRHFLHQVITSTPEHQFALALATARATSAQLHSALDTAAWLRQLLDLAQRFTHEVKNRYA